MPADHREIAFEAAIEESLLTHGGFLKGDPEAFERRPRPPCSTTSSTPSPRAARWTQFTTLRLHFRRLHGSVMHREMTMPAAGDVDC